MNSLLYIAVAACVVASTCASYGARYAPLGGIAHQIQPEVTVQVLPNAGPYGAGYGAPLVAPYGAGIAAPLRAGLAAPLRAGLAAPYGIGRPGYGLRAPIVDGQAIGLANLALALPVPGGPLPESYVPRQVNIVPGAIGTYGSPVVKAAPAESASAAAASSNAAPVSPARTY